VSRARTLRVAALGSAPVVTAALYWHARAFGFIHLDDGSYVAANSHVLAGLSLEGLRWAWTQVHGGLYQPLVWMSLQLDSTLFGNSPASYRTTSIALHALSVLWLALLSRSLASRHGNTGEERRTAATLSACGAALLFGLHPLRVESVTWISERKDTLSVCFALAACAVYAREANQTLHRRAFAYALALCAFLSKPSLCTLPACFVLLDTWPSLELLRVWQSVRRHAVLWVAGGVTAAGAKLSTFASGMSAGTDEVSAALRWKLLPVTFAEYLGKTVWPSHLSLYYYVFEPETAKVALCVAGVLAAGTLLWLSRRRVPELAWGATWFLATLLPTLIVFHVTYARMGDRYTYLPHAGIAVALTAGALRLATTPLRRTLLAAGTAGALGLACIVSWAQLATWQSWKTVYVQALSVEPNNPFITWQFADANLRNGDAQMAVRAYERLVHANVRGPAILFGLAEAREAAGQLDAALDGFQDYLAAQGPNEEALSHVRGLSLRRPDHPLKPETRALLRASEGLTPRAPGEAPQ
jgi:hypothetical protein